jgi:hypothetical protein
MSNPPLPAESSNSRRRRPNSNLNANLDRIDEFLGMLNDAASLVPVPGCAVAVPIVRKIVRLLRVRILLSWYTPTPASDEDIQKANENSEAAVELSEDVEELVELIHVTAESVRCNIKSMEESIGEEGYKFPEVGQYKKPDLFDTMVVELERYVTDS